MKNETLISVKVTAKNAMDGPEVRSYLIFSAVISTSSKLAVRMISTDPVMISKRAGTSYLQRNFSFKMQMERRT